jgi:hypothetical protein
MMKIMWQIQYCSSGRNWVTVFFFRLLHRLGLAQMFGKTDALYTSHCTLVLSNLISFYMSSHHLALSLWKTSQVIFCSRGMEGPGKYPTLGSPWYWCQVVLYMLYDRQRNWTNDVWTRWQCVHHTMPYHGTGWTWYMRIESQSNWTQLCLDRMALCPP